MQNSLFFALVVAMTITSTYYTCLQTDGQAELTCVIICWLNNWDGHITLTQAACCSFYIKKLNSPSVII